MEFVKLAAVAALSAGVAFTLPAAAQSTSKSTGGASTSQSAQGSGAQGSTDSSRSAASGSSADNRSAATGQSSPRDLGAGNESRGDDTNWDWLGLLGLVGLAGLRRRNHVDTRYDNTTVTRNVR